MSNTEWLQTNGLGSFACGPVSGAPSRRYHGLLCGSLNPPTNRQLLVSHLIESVDCCGEYRALSCEHYVGHRPETEIEPTGFKLKPYAYWEYCVAGNILAKSITMVEAENTTLVRYQNKGAQPLTLHLKPLLALRDYHALRTDNPFVNLQTEPHGLKVATEDMPSVFITNTAGEWKNIEAWYHQLYYAQEADRGFDAVDENYCPAELSVTLAPKQKFILRLSTEEGRPTEMPFLQQDSEYNNIVKNDLELKQIEYAAQQFIVERASTQKKTILAGYPWFTDWGRDTLIALRDFQDFLSPQEARDIITTFLAYEKDGLIPNRFPDDPADTIEYNTVDASLWLFVAAWELQQKNPSQTFLKQIFPALSRIIKAHLNGTHFNIKVLESGLLSAGQEPWQLTWMDAKIGDYSVTPRMGCAVEVNMLWYNALQIYQQFGALLKKESVNVEPYISLFEKNFSTHFWNAESKCLYDVVIPGCGRDDKIRCNQIYALSLPFTVLASGRQSQVLACVKNSLYTPLGLRTLSTNDPDFKPVYQGDTWSRDTAYHQGTVWPFLLREYWVAHEKIEGKKKTRATLKTEVETLKAHFYNDSGVGSVSEIFDGQNPGNGKGTPWQAWSVAALWKIIKLMN